MITLWKSSAEFASFYSSVLSRSPYDSFFWECPPITAAKAASTPFEHVTVRAGGFRPASPADFQEHFAACAPSADVVAFTNLGGDSQLVAPCPVGPMSHYGHIAAFVRQASPAQQARLWGKVGETMQKTMEGRGERKTWLSTEGSGVPWLHVRQDSRPKYYHHDAYRHGA